MTNLADVFEPRGVAAPVAVQGHIAAVDGADVYAILPSFDAVHRWGPLLGTEGATGLARGDDCLVVFDEDREPWLVNPSAGAGGAPIVDVNATAHTTTLAPGAAASVLVTEPTANLFDFAFGIPTGAVGPQGVKGDTGASGAAGAQGPQGATGAQGPQGAQGVKGDTGAMGPMGTVYDSDQIGTIKTWSGKTIPTNWALANGARLDRATYPQGYDFAKAEADAGNSLWTYRASDTTFTVPDLTDRFMLAPGVNALGARGGETAHLLLAGEAAQKAVISGTESANHVHAAGNGQTFMTSTLSVGLNGDGGAAATWLPNGWTGNTAAQNVAHTHALAGSDAATAHNNMPPWVAIGQIVKLKGVTVDSGGAITGPPGAPGADGANGGQVYTAQFGNGTASSFAIAHGLNSRAVTVSVYRTSSPWDEVQVDVERTDANTVTLRTFPTVPATNEYTAVIASPGAPAPGQSGALDIWHVVGTAGEPAFTGGWVNYAAGGWATAAFRKGADGKVKLRGAVKTGGAGSAVFVLPAGCRPPAQVGFPVNTSLNLNVPSTLYIDATGNVIPGATVNNAFLALDGIEFDTDTVTTTAPTFYVGPARVTVLPSAPVDGQEIYYVADATNGVLWHFRYNAASASPYKWECVGGSRTRGSITGPVAFGAPASFAWTTLPSGPSVTAPLAGEYEIDWNAVVTTTSAATLDFRFKPNVATAYNIPSGGSTHGGGGVINGKGSGVYTVTSGQAVFLQYATPSLSLAVTAYETVLWLRPVRVG